MRKLFLFPAVFLGTLVVFQSCSKQSVTPAVSPMATNVINATIALNGSYQLPIDNPGNVSISMQASHFQLSQTEADSKSGFTLYKYIPAAGYTGTDEVVLTNTKAVVSNEGGCPNNPGSNSDNTTAATYITVKINITN